jgi:hypothetical protein
MNLAEGQGFEPWVQGLPAQRISSAPRSTAPAPLQETVRLAFIDPQSEEERLKEHLAKEIDARWVAHPSQRRSNTLLQEAHNNSV